MATTDKTLPILIPSQPSPTSVGETKTETVPILIPTIAALFAGETSEYRVLDEDFTISDAISVEQEVESGSTSEDFTISDAISVEQDAKDRSTSEDFTISDAISVESTEFGEKVVCSETTSMSDDVQVEYVSRPIAEAHNAVRSNFNKASGKWYWEVTIDSGTIHYVGVATADASLNGFAGADEHAYSYHDLDGKKYTNAGGSTYGDTYVAGDVIGVALDLDNNEVFFSKNGVWQDSGDPAAGTDPAYSITDGVYYAIWSGYDGGEVTANFGDSAFSYAAPTGFGDFGAGSATITWDADYTGGDALLTATGLKAYTTGLADIGSSCAYLGSTLATLGKTSGKWYWEVIVNTSGLRAVDDIVNLAGTRIGIATNAANLDVAIGTSAQGYAYDPNGNIYNNGIPQAYGDAFRTSGDIIGVALDLDNNKIWFSKNGTWQDSGAPADGTDHAFSFPAAQYFPAGTVVGYAITTLISWTSFYQHMDIIANFGDTDFAYTAPIGFLAYNSAATVEEPVITETTTTSDDISVNVEYGAPESVIEAEISEGFTTADTNFADLPGESEDPTSGTAGESFTVSDAITAEMTSQVINEGVTTSDSFVVESSSLVMPEGVTLADTLASADTVMNTTIAEDVEMTADISGGFEIEDTNAEGTTTADTVAVEKELGIVYQNEGVTTSDSIEVRTSKENLVSENAYIASQILWGWAKTAESEAAITDEVSIDVNWPVHDYIGAIDTVASKWVGTETVESKINAVENLTWTWPELVESAIAIVDAIMMDTPWGVEDGFSLADINSAKWVGTETVSDSLAIRSLPVWVWDVLAESTIAAVDAETHEVTWPVKDYISAVVSVILNRNGIETVEEALKAVDDLIWRWNLSPESTIAAADTNIIEVTWLIRDWLTANDIATSKWVGTEIVEDSVYLFGQAILIQVFNEVATSEIVATDATSALHQMISVAASTLNIADTAGNQIDFNPTVIEAMAVAGALSVILKISETNAETIDAVDSTVWGWDATIEESASAVGTAAILRYCMDTVVSSMACVETAISQLMVDETITETLEYATVLAIKQMLQASVTDEMNLGITITLGDEQWECWVMNSNKFNFSVYSNFDFNSYCSYGNQSFGCRADGIYRLDGTTDNDVAFNAGIVLPETTFGTSRKKRFRKAYFGLSGTTPSIRMETSSGNQTYSITSSKASLSRSQYGKEWTLKVQGYDDMDFIELIPIILTR